MKESGSAEPTRVDAPVEVFSYLVGDVVHCKVNNEGHGAVHGISEKALLDFLDQGERKGASQMALTLQFSLLCW
jgi:hypothetical protein